MSDKTKAVIVMWQGEPVQNELLEVMTTGGNTSLLVMRKASLKEDHGVFNAISGLS